jgi:hypothetical protein
VRLERRRDAAALAARARRPSRDTVGSCAIGKDDAQLERAARGPRPPRARERDLALLADDHLPANTVSVLVDLDLDLDPAILLAQLQLDAAAFAAGPGCPDVVVAGGCGRLCCEDDGGCEEDGGEKANREDVRAAGGIGSRRALQ